MQVRLRVRRKDLQGRITLSQYQEISLGESVQIDDLTYKQVLDDDYVNDDHVEVDIFGPYRELPEWLVVLNPPVWITIPNKIEVDQSGSSSIKISAEQVEVHSDSLVAFLRSACIMAGECAEFADDVSEKML